MTATSETYFFTSELVWEAPHPWGSFRPRTVVTDDNGQVRDSDIVHTDGLVTVTHGRPLSGRIDLGGPGGGSSGIPGAISPTPPGAANPTPGNVRGSAGTINGGAAGRIGSGGAGRISGSPGRINL